MNRLLGVWAAVFLLAACGDDPKVTYKVEMLEGTPEDVSVVYNEHEDTKTVDVELPWTHTFTAGAPVEAPYVGAVVSNTNPSGESLSVRVSISIDGKETAHADDEGTDLASATASDSL